ncbi:MAG: hypothetical protein ABW110_09285 [Steroidobacteraceae bacterium]
MRQWLLTTVAFAAVIVGGTGLLNAGRVSAAVMAAENSQLEAGLRSYCSKSRALIGRAYFATLDKSCRSARRLNA